MSSQRSHVTNLLHNQESFTVISDGLFYFRCRTRRAAFDLRSLCLVISRIPGIWNTNVGFEEERVGGWDEKGGIGNDDLLLPHVSWVKRSDT